MFRRDLLRSVPMLEGALESTDLYCTAHRPRGTLGRQDAIIGLLLTSACSLQKVERKSHEPRMQ